LDLNSGSFNWQIPFGQKKMSKNITSKGDINFGGILSTNGDIFFATGTPDNYVRAYDSKNGKELWNFKLDYAGSAPPMTYFYDNNQYIIVNSSGGRFFGFDEKLADFENNFDMELTRLIEVRR